MYQLARNWRNKKIKINKNKTRRFTPSKSTTSQDFQTVILVLSYLLGVPSGKFQQGEFVYLL